MEGALESLIFHCKGPLISRQPFLLVFVGTIGSLERGCWASWNQHKGLNPDFTTSRLYRFRGTFGALISSFDHGNSLPFRCVCDD